MRPTGQTRRAIIPGILERFATLARPDTAAAKHLTLGTIATASVSVPLVVVDPIAPPRPGRLSARRS